MLGPGSLADAGIARGSLITVLLTAASGQVRGRLWSGIVPTDLPSDRDSTVCMAIPPYVIGESDRERWEHAVRIADGLFPGEAAMVWQTTRVLYHRRETFPD